MPLYFIQVTYGPIDNPSSVDDKIKFFKNQSEIKAYRKRLIRGKLAYLKEIESLDEIFYKNLDLSSEKDYRKYYKTLRKSLGSHLDIFPYPNFTKEYLDKIEKLSEDYLHDLIDAWSSLPPSQQDLDFMYGKKDWEEWE